MGKLIDITGKKFNRLLVIKRSYIDSDNFIRWECICDCGNIYYGRSYPLRKGTIKSCGCLEKENLISLGNKGIHYLSKEPIYKVWKSMKSRCYNKKNNRFHRYGGRGIKVCEEWINNPEAFIKWSFSNGYKKGLSLDRTDNNGNYIPDNCRWVTIVDNNRNSSSCKINIEIVKEIRILASKSNLKQQEIADKYDITQQTVSKIINKKSWI